MCLSCSYPRVHQLELVSFDVICTGTMKIFMASHPVLVDAYFTSSVFWGFFSISVFIISFLLIFLNFQTMQYCGVSFTGNLHIILLAQLFVLYYPWFDPEILDISQYHNGDHKQETFPYLTSSHCLLSPSCGEY